MKKVILILTLLILNIVFLAQSAYANNLPFGGVDIVTTNRVVGWAYDPDAGSSAIDVHIYVNGGFWSWARADGYRPDVPANDTRVQGQYHGFWFPVGTMSWPEGTRIDVYAINLPLNGQNPRIGGAIAYHPKTDEVTIGNYMKASTNLVQYADALGRPIIMAGTYIESYEPSGWPRASTYYLKASVALWATNRTTLKRVKLNSGSTYIYNNNYIAITRGAMYEPLYYKNYEALGVSYYKTSASSPTYVLTTKDRDLY